MNRVHEQCSKIDSGTVLSQTGSKQAECTKCTAHWPSSTLRPCALPRPACLCCLPPTSAHQCRSCRAPTCAPACPAPVRAQRPHALAACAPIAPAAHLLAVSWLGWALYRNTVQPCLCSTDAIHLSVLRYNSSLPSLLL